MKRFFHIFVLGTVFVIVLVPSGAFEIKNIASPFLRILWSNFNSISIIIYILVPLLLLLIIVLLFITNKWVLRVERMSFGGFNIIFDNPAKIYRRQVKSLIQIQKVWWRFLSPTWHINHWQYTISFNYDALYYSCTILLLNNFRLL